MKEKKEKDRILFIGKVIDDKGTVQILDNPDQSAIDRAQKAIDLGHVKVVK